VIATFDLDFDAILKSMDIGEPGFQGWFGHGWMLMPLNPNRQAPKETGDAVRERRFIPQKRPLSEICLTSAPGLL
jgi:hypothetical protein